MKRRLLTLCLTASILLSLTGCRDRVDLEDLTLALTIGIDLNENNQLLFSISSPVFSKEATKKAEEFTLMSSTLRYSREEFDAVATALTSSSKAQVILIGKKIVQHDDWNSLLDVMFRDAKSSLNAKVAIVDGPVQTFVSYSPKDKPRLPLYLTKLIATADRRNITFKASLAQMHTQFLEKGMTPAITELKMDHDMKVVGTALLDHRGKYAGTLLHQESVLLHVLRDHKRGQLSITMPVSWKKDNLFRLNRMSFYAQNIRRSIKVGYQDGKFSFKIIMKVSALLTERLFPIDSRKYHAKLEKAIKEDLEKQSRKLIAKLQKEKLDPIGLGMYARAYQYKAWKQVEDQWDKAISQADIDIQYDVKLLNTGLIK